LTVRRRVQRPKRLGMLPTTAFQSDRIPSPARRFYQLIGWVSFQDHAQVAISLLIGLTLFFVTAYADTGITSSGSSRAGTGSTTAAAAAQVHVHAPTGCCATSRIDAERVPAFLECSKCQKICRERT
jgi:hypothetical protein